VGTALNAICAAGNRGVAVGWRMADMSCQERSVPSGGLTELPAASDTLADLLHVRRLIDEAVRVLVRVSDRALGAGRIGSAADLVRRAWDLLDIGGPDPNGTAEVSSVLEKLLVLLIQAGRLKDVGEVVGWIDELDCTGLPADSLAGLRALLAWALRSVGDLDEAAAQLVIARDLISGAAGDVGRVLVLVDAVAGRLAADTPDSAGTAERLSVRALAGAVAVGEPEVACHAWEALGIVARSRDIGESVTCFARMDAMARAHGLTYWRLLAQLQLGINDWIADGDRGRLATLLHVAPRVGVAAVGSTARTVVAFDAVRGARYAEAGTHIAHGWAEAAEGGLSRVLRELTAVRALLAGLRGRRRELEAVADELGQGDGAFPIMALARTCCALLEEDHERATAELDSVDADEPGRYQIAGLRGIRSLLAAVSDQSTEPDEMDEPCSRWNRQFVLFARAVRLGRNGSTTLADEAMRRAEGVAASFPVAGHLGLRLVAEAAYRDGWGRPTEWLRIAEVFFHDADAPAVAGAARSLLRRFGAPVPRRRGGVEQMPEALRRFGVTVREVQVLRLLLAGEGNRAIAARLYISHRTVEKHVANLMMKLDQPNRMALADRVVGLFEDLAG
jgi:DNA-binding CsgD family transcriptional regulator